jgi:hypothetical protein
MFPGRTSGRARRSHGPLRGDAGRSYRPSARSAARRNRAPNAARIILQVRRGRRIGGGGIFARMIRARTDTSAIRSGRIAHRKRIRHQFGESSSRQSGESACNRFAQHVYFAGLPT